MALPRILQRLEKLGYRVSTVLNYCYQRQLTALQITIIQCLDSVVIPFGGGADGKSPLYVQKGDIIEINYRSMCRDEDFWGPDVNRFVPERWETVRPGWEYTPFGAGPRSCPGMRLVHTESAYVLVMLLREFENVESRDPEPEWKEEMRMTAQSKNGCLVSLTPDHTSP